MKLLLNLKHMTDLLTDKKRSKFQISLMKNLTQLLKHALKLMLLSKERLPRMGLYIDGKRNLPLVQEGKLC